MRTRTIQISQADLINSQSTPLQIDIGLTYSEPGKLVRYMLPRQIRLENGSGITVYFTLIRSEDELTEYINSAPYYSLLPLINTDVLVNPNNGNDNILIIQAGVGSPTTGMTFYGMLYQ